MGLSDKIKKKLVIDASHLNDEIIKQPGEYAYYSHQCVKKKRELDLLVLDLDVLIAKKDSKYRDCFVKSGKKLTESQLEKLINKTDAVIKLRRDIIDIKCRYKILKGVVAAYEQRKDCLISISANRREEMKSHVAVIE